jgi:hypothetical protein
MTVLLKGSRGLASGIGGQKAVKNLLAMPSKSINLRRCYFYAAY